MNIAVMGAGLTGAYLYRLLKARNRAVVDVFDRGPGTRCGLTPCAWGTSRGFHDLVEASGLDPSRYILKRTDHIIMDGLRIKADLMTFDKPGLIRDLLQGAKVSYSLPDLAGYDRIIDATGAARAFLPPVEDDVILPCLQRRVEADVPLGNQIQLGRIGYGWCFPLTSREYHIGCGSLLSDPRTIMGGLGFIADSMWRSTIICACSGSIRLSGPHYSGPFVALHGKTEVWGVGEAIGCVAPLAGDGIIPGMKSVQILIEFWDDPSGYRDAILREFRWMKEERAVVEKLRKGASLSLGDAWVLKKNSRRMGMQVRIGQAARLLEHLR
jgi:flavin-dependent dehydrogenase